eukprot:EG_transcript_37903
MAADGNCSFRQISPRKRKLACPLAYHPALELPRGVKAACVPNGTRAVANEATALYIDAIIKSVVGYHIHAFHGVIDGSDYPPESMPYVLTMVGFRRLHNVQSLLEAAIFHGVPGDFIETGVWRGGLCLVA